MVVKCKSSVIVMNIKLVFSVLLVHMSCYLPHVSGSELYVLNVTQSSSFDWVSNGEVFYVQSRPNKPESFIITNAFGEKEIIHSNGGGPEWNVAYLFRNENGVISMISRDAHAASAFIQCQLNGKEGSELFVNDMLTYVIAGLFSERNYYIINDAYINAFSGLQALSFGVGVTVEDIDSTRHALSRYKSRMEPDVSDGKWSLMIYILRGDGGVDKLVASGHVYPFQILVCDVKECEPKGTYVVIPVM